MGPTNLTSGIMSSEARRGRRAVILYEAHLLGIPALLHDLLVDRVTLGHPAAVSRRQSALAGDPARPLQGHPTQKLGGDELAPATPDLPDSLVGLTPVLSQSRIFLGFFQRS